MPWLKYHRFSDILCNNHKMYIFRSNVHSLNSLSADSNKNRYRWIVTAIATVATFGLLAAVGKFLPSSFSNRNPNPSAAMISKTSATGKASYIECKLDKVKDTGRTGLVAFTYLIPNGWVAAPTLAWNSDISLFGEFQAHTKDLKYYVDQVEPFNMSYSSLPGGPHQGFRIVHATDFLKVLLRQVESKGLASNVKIIDEKNSEIPLTAQEKQLYGMARNMSGSTDIISEAGFLEVSFQKGSEHGIATFATIVKGTLSSSPAFQGRYETGNYVIGPTMFVLRPTQVTSQRAAEIRILEASLRMTPQFTLYLLKLETAHSQGAIRAIHNEERQEQSEWRARSMSRFKAQMASKDAHTREFCDYISDQQEYVGAGGRQATLPANYIRAWADNSGDYILTNSYTYNPKKYSNNQSWGLLHKKPMTH